jgi:hypothetical protein
MFKHNQIKFYVAFLKILLYLLLRSLNNNRLMARLNLLEETRFEKLPVTVFKNPKEASISVARSNCQHY